MFITFGLGKNEKSWHLCCIWVSYPSSTIVLVYIYQTKQIDLKPDGYSKNKDVKEEDRWRSFYYSPTYVLIANCGLKKKRFGAHMGTTLINPF